MENKINLNTIATEQINPNTKNIDSLSTLEMIETINKEDQKVALSIAKETKYIAEAVDVIHNSVDNGGRLIYCGAGTSGRLGILDASECPPTYGVDKNMVIGLIAGGEKAIRESVENAEDSKEFAVADLKAINFTNKDVLVGIAASGRTPYVIGGLEYANSIGASTIAIACSKNSPIGNVAKIKIEVELDGEVITGSTRMKSGTAQKMILNMLSTGLMVKLGKVYGNLMVDVKPLNAKLIERAKKIFMEATQKNYETATNYLSQTDFNVKLAILMEKTGLDLTKAKNALLEFKGLLHKAIQNYKK